MKLCVFNTNWIGVVVNDDAVVDVTAAFDSVARPTSPYWLTRLQSKTVTRAMAHFRDWLLREAGAIAECAREDKLRTDEVAGASSRISSRAL